MKAPAVGPLQLPQNNKSVSSCQPTHPHEMARCSRQGIDRRRLSNGTLLSEREEMGEVPRVRAVRMNPKRRPADVMPDAAGNSGSETVWNNQPTGASSGGLSAVFSESAYQQTVPDHLLFQGQRGGPAVAFQPRGA